jgi:hypothetical protein
MVYEQCPKYVQSFLGPLGIDHPHCDRGQDEMYKMLDEVFENKADEMFANIM